MKYIGFVLLALSSYVMAEEVYYCSDNVGGVTGFKDINGQYKSVNFKEDKFKMKITYDLNIKIEDAINGKRHLDCSQRFVCRVRVTLEDYGYSQFTFNPDNDRYVWFYGGGYAMSDGDVMTRIGTCTKF